MGRRSVGWGRASTVAELVADAEAEVNQRGESDEEADPGVEVVEGDEGDPAKTYTMEDGVAEEIGKSGEHES